ncbi:MAG: hypothetical protein ACFE8N_13110, partial [Promethearchaeota archaeon]
LLFWFLYFKKEIYSVKKKIIIVILLVSILQLFNLSNLTLGFDCNLYYLEVNKAEYFVNENIEVNALWELHYDPVNEECYTQIRIFNSSGTLIWNSSKYNGIGQFTQNWNINVTQLNTPFLNYSNILYIKFFSYYSLMGGSEYSSFLETIQIEIIKRIPLCQLIGFKDHIENGESFIFQANFIDHLFENNSYLKNQLIVFTVVSNNSIIHEKNYTTNQFGTIEIYLSSISHLDLGLNTLVFVLNNNLVYNTSKFVYQIYVEKNTVLIDVVSFNKHLKFGETLEITLLYYYYINSSIIPLNNQSIRVTIFDNLNLTYSKVYTTDILGQLVISLPQESFNFETGINELIINFTFNGTVFLKNNIYSLDLKIGFDKQHNIFIPNILIFISISIVLSLISLYLVKKFKRERKKMLAGITIRY